MKDQISELQAGIINLVAQTSLNLTELSYKVPYRSIDGSNLPVAPVPVKELQEQLSEEEYDRFKVEMAMRYVQSAKDVERLIDNMPDKQDSDIINDRIRTLEAEMKAANDEYAKALLEAKALEGEFKSLLDVTLKDLSDTATS